MPQSIIDADTWTATVEVAADGDPVDGASQLLIGQDLADRTRYIRNRTLGPVGDGLDYHSPLGDNRNINNWNVAGTGLVEFTWEQTATGGLVDVYATPLVLPASGRITKVEATVDGIGGQAAGPHAALPAQMPVLTLYRQNLLGTGVKAVAVTSVTDPSTTVGAYETPHLISITGLSEDIDAKKTWWITLSGEGGANAIALALLLTDIRAYVEPAP